jgi:hypothetical protein
MVLLLFLSELVDNRKHHIVDNRKLKSVKDGVGSNHILYVP